MSFIGDRLQQLRRWLGPLGHYRPSFLRKDMAQGFHNCDTWTLPAWAHLLHCTTPEERLLEGLPLSGKVIYDIGAFTGAYSLFFSRRAGPQGRVIAFEPRAQSFSMLVANLERNHVRNVLPLPVALGDCCGAQPIFMLPGMPTTASLAPEAQTPLRRQTGEARIEPLDLLVTSLPLPPPSFMKVDVEGYELEVLRGAADTVGRYHPDLLIEIHGAGAQQKAERAAGIAAFLEPFGYSLLHAESGARLGASSSPISSGHLYARAT